jgi:hypothetical protein
MNFFSGSIRQHGSHNALTNQNATDHGSAGDLQLDAIVVPGSRPAEKLDHAVTLARAADCWLMVICSQWLERAAVEDLLAARLYHKAIVIDLPDDYSHELLSFPGLRSIASEMPVESRYYVTDLSMKRNIALVIARMVRWRHIFFLDDDIRDVSYPDLQHTVNMLGSFATAGMWVTEFPDNSIVCHANRATRGPQDVFVSGAALAVNCDEEIGFFPDLYNEDWLFFFDDASAGRLGNSHRRATQLVYDPFADPQRAAWQEFGDTLAEGLYALLHLGLRVEDSTCEYWTQFIEARRKFLETVRARLQDADPTTIDKILPAVDSALTCLQAIQPELCERYIQMWRHDLADWKEKIRRLPTVSIGVALKQLGLENFATHGWQAEASQPLTELAAPAATAGRAMIPRFGTLEEMSDKVDFNYFGVKNTIPFSIPDLAEYQKELVAAGDSDNTSPDDARRPKGRKLRFTILRRTAHRGRHEAPRQLTPTRELCRATTPAGHLTNGQVASALSQDEPAGPSAPRRSAARTASSTFPTSTGLNFCGYAETSVDSEILA